MKATKKILLVSISLFFMLAATPFDAGYQIGDTVSDFKLKNVDGKTVSLSDYSDKKGVILIFDCNTCPYSKAYNDRIKTLNENYSKKGFPVIAINANDAQISPGDSFKNMVEYASKNDYKFPYLIDETQKVAHAFGATNTPHVYVLKNDNKTFKVAYIGAIDNNSRDASQADKKYVEDAVNALLQDEAVPVEKTKAIGCTIKFRNS